MVVFLSSKKDTVVNVIREKSDVFGFPPTERKARAEKMPAADKRALIAIVADGPLLFLIEKTEELH